jgi:leucyl aminopeptidase
MPLVKEYRPALTSAVADISNITSYASPDSFGGGSITAALYLQEFISDSKWLHLDIAGVGRSESDSGENVKGGTGYGPRLLLEWLASL